MAGQATAVRVTGDPNPANNGRFYIHSDHLGSTSALTKYSDGYIVGSSLTRYTPFGSYRTGGPNQITDRAYTGQKENMDLGLYYYNARYYLPGAGRFLSADTLVPDPRNPQSLNRYAYALNSPINFSDPTGHAECASQDCGLVWHPANGNVMVRNVNTSSLYQLIQRFARSGNSAARQLSRVLAETGSPGGKIGNLTAMGQFEGIGGTKGDSGFQTEFQDDYLYANLWNINTPASRQVGHFLSAVKMGFDQDSINRQIWLYAIVRHEQYSDVLSDGKSGQVLGLARQAIPLSILELRATNASIKAFLTATDSDALGLYDSRDTLLQGIYNLGSGTPEERVGNSMADLRLSVRGWRLGNMVANGDITTSQGIANWLALYVAGN